MNNEFWNYLLEQAEAIASLSSSEMTQKDEATSKLESLELMFDRQFDPADSYQEFVALKLCKGFLSFLDHHQS